MVARLTAWPSQSDLLRQEAQETVQVPFPDALRGKYQFATWVDLKALFAVGDDHAFAG